MANVHKEPNFNPTGGNTAPRNKGTSPGVALKSQKKAFDYDKFGSGIGKTTSNNSGSSGGRRGGGAKTTFMNK